MKTSSGFSTSSSVFLALTVVITLLCLFRFFFLGDVPFINDEAQLLWRALDDNQKGGWTTYGLRGSRGMDYGPVPILFYRAILTLTHSPLEIVFLKTAFISLLTATSVLWLLALCPWIPRLCGLVPFLSPYLWHYSRDLWDNSLTPPLTGLLFCAYLTFVHTHRARFLLLSALLAALTLQIHLLSLPLLVAIALHSVLFEKTWLQKKPVWALVSLALFLALLAPYSWHLATSPQSPTAFKLGWGLFHGFFGLLGSRLFSGIGYEYFLGARWYEALPLLGPIAMALTAYALVPSLRGALLAKKQLEASPKESGFCAAFLSLVSIGLHICVVTLQQLINHPHYYGAVWIAFFYLLCLGAGPLLQKPSGKRRFAVYLSSLLVCLAMAAWQSHRGVGSDNPHYGMPLWTKMEIARELNCTQAPPGPPSTAVETLRRLVPCTITPTSTR